MFPFLVDPPWSPLARWVTLLLSWVGKAKQYKARQGNAQIVEILTLVTLASFCGSTLDSSGLVLLCIIMLVDPPWSPLARGVTLLLSWVGKSIQGKARQYKAQIVEILTVVLCF